MKEQKNLALIEEIVKNIAVDNVIAICEPNVVYKLSFNFEGHNTIKINLVDENTGEIIQHLNTHIDFTSGKYTFRFFTMKAGLLRFDVVGEFGFISNIKVVEENRI